MRAPHSGHDRLTTMSPFDMIVFGGTGDLAMRKLMPALLHRCIDGQIDAASRIVGVGRSNVSADAYTKRVEEACRKSMGGDFTERSWSAFVPCLDYVAVDAASEDGFSGLQRLLGPGPSGNGDAAAPGRVRVFYLATAPDLFGPTCVNLGRAGLVTPETRVVLEKPIGRDLSSSRAINDAVGSVFREEQIFRIDHYLGKEAVQNLLALRFANTLFEPVWNASGVDHLQITVAETLGIEGRGGYYDHSGALRDMVQNHMLQLLCLTTMEPPARFEPDAIRDEKRKVLHALRPLTDAEVVTHTVRGQYRAGVVDGKQVPGYVDEIDRSGDPSSTETFVAIKGEIANWRWGGVPFYLRTGKRLAGRGSEIVVQFRDVPHDIFPIANTRLVPNRLIIRVQPDEGIRLDLMTKVPGTGGMRLRPAPLDLSFAEEFHGRSPEAYERLLLDVVRGDSTLFMRRDEIEAAWSWVEPILQVWEDSSEPPRSYPAGSWGPSSAIALIERDGRTWSENLD
ncbi:MAG: glucose-6-phosphate dehydrogenase [Alphaproteobacteria bacterium]|nr:glucose-6-phosphate dehydrogenase [Alphaproteobacteria bacterium]